MLSITKAESIPQQATPNKQETSLITRVVGKLGAYFQKLYDLSDEDTSDLVQEGTVAALQAFRSYEPTTSRLSTWIHIRARGEMLDALRKLRNGGITGEGNPEFANSENMSIETVNFDPEDETPEPDVTLGLPTEHPTDDPVLSAEVLQMLAYVSRLPASRADLVLRRYGIGEYHTHTLEELSALYEISVPAVNKRLALCLDLLRLKMSGLEG